MVIRDLFVRFAKWLLLYAMWSLSVTLSTLMLHAIYRAFVNVSRSDGESYTQVVVVIATCYWMAVAWEHCTWNVNLLRTAAYSFGAIVRFWRFETMTWLLGPAAAGLSVYSCRHALGQYDRGAIDAAFVLGLVGGWVAGALLMRARDWRISEQQND